MNWWRRFEKAVLEGLITFLCRYYLKKPDVTQLVKIKIPTFRTAFTMALNELCFIIGIPYSFRLTSINIEITNNCNLACEMCPVNRGMSRAKGFIDFNFFKKLIDDNRYLDFILPFQWGEPLLHPQLCEMIQYAGQRGIRTMITTNGKLLSDELIEKLLHSGLERITFSVDGPPHIHSQIRGMSYEELKNKIIRFKELRERMGKSVKIDISMVVFEKTEEFVERFFAEWRPIADRVQVIPKMERFPRTSRCRELWRGMLVVFWDGRVAPCCVDYNGELVVGDARKESLRDIFNGPAMQTLRRQHRKRRFSGLCKLCGEYASRKVSPRFQ